MYPKNFKKVISEGYCDELSVIVFTTQNVHIINVNDWNIIKKISLSHEEITNSYYLNDKYFLFLDNKCLSKKSNDENKISNIIFMKIDNNINEILFEVNLRMESKCYNLYYINKNNEKYIMSHNFKKDKNCAEFSFYKLVNMKKIKKLNINGN